MIGPEISFETELSIHQIDRTSPSNIPIETTIMTVVTIVEVRVDQLINDAISTFRANAEPLARYLASERRGTLTQTWAARHRVLTKGFGITAIEGQVGQRFLALVEARNALTHGNGRLTDQQIAGKPTRTLALVKNLERLLNIPALGTALVPGADSRPLAVMAGRDYLLATDIGVRAYPSR